MSTFCTRQGPSHEAADRVYEHLQMVIPESDLSTLDRVNSSGFRVATYKAAFTKQVSTPMHLQILKMHAALREHNCLQAAGHHLFLGTDNVGMHHLQEVKELVRGTREAVGSNFLGSLESFLVYLDSLMKYCELFLEDEEAKAVMKVLDLQKPPCRVKFSQPLMEVHGDCLVPRHPGVSGFLIGTQCSSQGPMFRRSSSAEIALWASPFSSLPHRIPAPAVATTGTEPVLHRTAAMMRCLVTCSPTAADMRAGL